MDEQERDYFRKMIHDLERAKRRWQAFALILLVGFVLFGIVGMGSVLVYSLGSGRAQMMEARMRTEEERAQAEAAAVRAEVASQQLREAEAKTKELQDRLEKDRQKQTKKE